MAEQTKKPDEEETKMCKHCGRPINPTCYGWIHKGRLVAVCNLFAEPEDSSGDNEMPSILHLKKVIGELIDGKCYIFQHGGSWRSGIFCKEEAHIGKQVSAGIGDRISAGDKSYFLEDIDPGTAYELPEV
jgi:hypothetical protein